VSIELIARPNPSLNADADQRRFVPRWSPVSPGSLGPNKDIACLR
jgi:hypothetical protein